MQRDGARSNVSATSTATSAISTATSCTATATAVTSTSATPATTQVNALSPINEHLELDAASSESSNTLAESSNAIYAQVKRKQPRQSTTPTTATAPNSTNPPMLPPRLYSKSELAVGSIEYEDIPPEPTTSHTHAYNPSRSEYEDVPSVPVSRRGEYEDVPDTLDGDALAHAPTQSVSSTQPPPPPPSYVYTGCVVAPGGPEALTALISPVSGILQQIQDHTCV